MQDDAEPKLTSTISLMWSVGVWRRYALSNFVADGVRARALGHSRPMHSVPVPINVRCYSNSDIIVRRSEVTLRATFVHCGKQHLYSITSSAMESSPDGTSMPSARPGRRHGPQRRCRDICRGVAFAPG